MNLREPIDSTRFKLALLSPTPLRVADVEYRRAAGGALLGGAQLRSEKALALVRGDVHVHLDGEVTSATQVLDPTVVVAPRAVMRDAARAAAGACLTIVGGVLACHPHVGNMASDAWPVPLVGVLLFGAAGCWPYTWRFMPPPLGPQRRELKL